MKQQFQKILRVQFVWMHSRLLRIWNDTIKTKTKQIFASLQGGSARIRGRSSSSTSARRGSSSRSASVSLRARGSSSRSTSSPQFADDTAADSRMIRRQQEPSLRARSGNPSRARSSNSARASFPPANPYASTARRSSGGGTSFSHSRSRRGNVGASGSLANLLSSLVARGAGRNFGRADEDQYGEETVAAQPRRNSASRTAARSSGGGAKRIGTIEWRRSIFRRW